MVEAKQSYSIITVGSKERSLTRFLGAVAEELEQKTKKLLFVSLVEIENRWNPAIELGNGINQTFVRAFNRSLNKSVQTKFEEALKNVNQFLDLNEEKVSEPINCVLAILDGAELYFSTVNRTHLYLWHAGKFNQITEPKTKSKRFATVTSGMIDHGDWLVGASSQLEAVVIEIEKAEVKIGPKVALLKRAVELVEPAERPNLAGVFLELSEKPEKQKIEVSELETRLPLKLPRISFNFAVVIGFARRVSQSIANQFKKIGARKSEPSIAIFENTDAEFDEPVLTEAAINQPAVTQLRRLPYRFIIAGGVFVILLVVGVVIIRNEFKTTGKPAKVSVSTIAELVSKIPTAQLFPFIEQNLTIDNYQNLTQKQRDSFNQTLSTNQLQIVTQAAKIIDVTSPIVAEDNNASALYLIDQTGQLWSYKTALTKVTQQTLIQNPVSVTALSGGKILVGDQAGGIWLFDGSVAQPTAMTLPPSLAQGAKLLDKFGSNVYLYQSSASAVYKVGGFISDIGTPDVFIPSTILNFGNLVDWTVPGEFIGATDDGTIKEFNKSKLDALSLKYYQDSNPIKICLTADGNSLVVARGKFVTTYSLPAGTKTSEKVLVTTDPINDIAVGPDKNIWVSAGKALYRF